MGSTMIGLLEVEVLEQRLAGQPVAAVDAHRVGAAHAVRAGATERQRAVLLPLDLVQGVEHAVGAVGADRELVPVRLAGAGAVVRAGSAGSCRVTSNDGIAPTSAAGASRVAVISTYAPSAGSGSS